MKVWLVVAHVVLLTVCAIASPEAPSSLRTDYRDNPLGLDNPRPRLSWRMEDSSQGAKQTAYQIQAAATESGLQAGENLLWDSGKVEGAQSSQIAYSGPALASRQRIFWRVRTWDAQGTESPWSKPAWFETALMDPADWRDAAWIGANFDLEEPELAPEGVMGDWVAASPDLAVKRWFLDVPLPDKGVVSAMCWWDARPKLDAANRMAGFVGPADGAEFLYQAELDRLLAWSTRGFADFGYYLQPGKTNRIGVAVKDPFTGAAITFGMRIVFVDGEELVVRSNTQWKAEVEDKPHPVSVVDSYGGEKMGVAEVYPANDLPPVWLRESLRVKPGLTRARLYMSGLGFARSYLNGREVDDHLVTPPQTDYDDFSYYTTQDLTPLLRVGDNALAVYLAPGFFHQVGGFGTNSYGHPGLKALVALDYADGSTVWVVSSANWEWKTGAITSAAVYLGERVDYRLDHDDWKSPGVGEGWQAARVMPPLTPRLEALDVPPVRATQTLQPVKKWQTGPRTWVYDFGEMLHGIVRFEFKAPAGTTVYVRYDEMCDTNGHFHHVPVSNWWCHAVQQGDSLISDGQPRVYQSEFCTKSFRYVEISGPTQEPTGVEALVVRTDVAPLMTFESSDPMLNRLFANGMRTFRNYLTHMVSDIPRERCLWGAENTYSWNTAFHGWDWPQNQKLMIDLWLTGPLVADGASPANIAVGKRGTTNPPRDLNWGISPLPLAYRMYAHYGDLEPAREHYDKLLRMMRYFGSQLGKDGLIRLPGYGDHAWPRDVRRKVGENKALIQTFGYYEGQHMFAVLADALGHTEDAAQARELAARARTAILALYDADGHTFGNGTHDSLALATGIFADNPEETAQLRASLAGHYQDNGHRFDGGFLSYNIYPELSRGGFVDDAYKMLVNDTYPGPAWSVTTHDATTYWEAYKTDFIDQRHRGLNFFAFAHPTGWMVTDLAGLRQDPAVPGGQRLILEPHIPVREKLDWVKGTLETRHGLARSAWRKEGNSVIWEFTIPANTTAEVSFPVPNFETDQGQLLRKETTRTVYEMDAGTYRMEFPLPPLPPDANQPPAKFLPTGMDEPTSTSVPLPPPTPVPSIEEPTPAAPTDSDSPQAIQGITVDTGEMGWLATSGDAWLPERLINRSGLDSGGRPLTDVPAASGSPHNWVSSKGMTTGSLVFTFEAPRDIETVLIWNGDDGKNPQRAVQTFSLFVSTEAEGDQWEQVLTDESLPMARPKRPALPKAFPLGQTGVRRVRLDILSNHGDPAFTMLQEVAFLPEPPQPAQ